MSTAYEAPFVPSQTEAEAGVLACLLFNPRLMARIADMLKPEHCHVDNYAAVYEAICNLHQRNKTSTLPNVRYELQRMQREVEQFTFSFHPVTGIRASLYIIQDYSETLLEPSRSSQVLSAGQW